MWSLGRPDAPSDEPVLIVGDRVTGATDEVLAAGVSLGMPRREAEALAPFATVLTRDPGEESRRFEPVVELIEDLIPRVEVVAPGLVFVPVAGAVRFYGGEETLAQHVAGGLDRLVGADRGGQALAGIADGPFAARWAAASAEVGRPLVVLDTIDFLSRLDLAALREGLDAEELIDTFRWLGVSTLGDLARLPRDVLATRFGNPGLLAHRLATGEDRFVDPREIPPDLAVDAEFRRALGDSRCGGFRLPRPVGETAPGSESVGSGAASGLDPGRGCRRRAQGADLAVGRPLHREGTVRSSVVAVASVDRVGRHPRRDFPVADCPRRSVG